MRWGKTVLLFQAVVTLILGIVFFIQVLNLDLSRVTEYKIEVQSEEYLKPQSPEYTDLRQRYSAASYILLFVSLMELAIIIKLLT